MYVPAHLLPASIASRRVVLPAPVFIEIRQVPLPDIGRVIPRLIEQLRQRHLILPHGDIIAVTAVLRRVTPGLQARTRRAAHGLDSKGVFELHALAGKLVQHRGCTDGRVVAAHRVPALLIGEKDQIFGCIMFSPLECGRRAGICRFLARGCRQQESGQQSKCGSNTAKDQIGVMEADGVVQVARDGR